MDAGIHANEWIGPATLIYFIDKVDYNYDTADMVNLIIHLKPQT